MSLKLIYKLDSVTRTRGDIPRVLRSFGRRPTVHPLVDNNGLLRCSTRVIPRNNLTVIPRLIGSNIVVINSTTNFYLGLNFAIHNVSLTVTSTRTTTAAIVTTGRHTSFSTDDLTRCGHRLRRDYIVHSVRRFHGVPTLVRGPHLFDRCPQVITSVVGSVFAVSNGPGRPMHGVVVKRTGGVKLVGLLGSNVGKTATL